MEKRLVPVVEVVAPAFASEVVVEAVAVSTPVQVKEAETALEVAAVAVVWRMLLRANWDLELEAVVEEESVGALFYKGCHDKMRDAGGGGGGSVGPPGSGSGVGKDEKGAGGGGTGGQSPAAAAPGELDRVL